MWLRTLGDAHRVGQRLIAICHNVDCRRRVELNLDEFVYQVGAVTSLVPVRGAVHFSERMKCSVCGHVGAFLWIDEPKTPTPFFGDASNNQVNLWDKFRADVIETVVARTSRTEMGYAAFEAAKSIYPGRRITLQEGARIVLDSRMTVIRGGRAG